MDREKAPLLSSATGTIQRMGWEKDEETGEEHFYVHMRFAGIPPLNPKLCWDQTPMAVMIAPMPEPST